MRSIINGFRYDTEKAIHLGDLGSHGSIPVTDFSWWEAGLYKTPKAGRYFLAGSGGPMTIFCKHESLNTMTGSEAIIPLTESEALMYAEKYLTSGVIEKHFQVEDA